MTTPIPEAAAEPARPTNIGAPTLVENVEAPIYKALQIIRLVCHACMHVNNKTFNLLTTCDFIEFPTNKNIKRYFTKYRRVVLTPSNTTS